MSAEKKKKSYISMEEMKTDKEREKFCTMVGNKNIRIFTASDIALLIDGLGGMLPLKYKLINCISAKAM